MAKKTKYAEVIYETGAKSIVSFDDLDELKASLVEQQRRATSGEPGGPDGHNAERVKRVLLYEDHPGDFIQSGMVDVSDAVDAVKSVAQGDQVSVWEVQSALRNQISPLVPRDQAGAHDSMYLAPQYDELAMDWLDFDPKKGAQR